MSLVVERIHVPVPLGKRVQAPYEVKSDCPKCQTQSVIRLYEEKSFLSYAIIGAAHKLTFWCEPCDTEWSHHIFIDLVITPVEEKPDGNRVPQATGS